MQPTQAITFRLPVPLYERLRQAAHDQREPQTAIVIRAIERELDSDKVPADG